MLGEIPTVAVAVAEEFEQVGQTFSGEKEDEFLGHSVAANVDGTIIATAGFGKVAVWQLGANSQWSMMGQKLTGEAEDHFGYATDLSGDGQRLIIGEPDYGNSKGRVLVYEFNVALNRWAEGASLEGVSEGDRAGSAVSISEDGATIAVGSPYRFANQVSNEGEVTVYKQQEGGSWGNTTLAPTGPELDPSWADWREGSGAFFGGAVALSQDGTRLAVGARLFPKGLDDDGWLAIRGAVRVFDLEGNMWKKVGSDMLGKKSFDRFGWSLDMSRDGGRIIVGAKTTNGPDAETYMYLAGSAAVFEFAAGGWGQIGQTFHGHNAEDATGSAVSISGDGQAIAIGHPKSDEKAYKSGRVDVYYYDPESREWVEAGAPLHGSAAGDTFGGAVAFSGNGNHLVVGAHGSDGTMGEPNDMKGYASVFNTEPRNM